MESVDVRRRQIIEIRNNSNYTDNQKNQLIQQLMMGVFNFNLPIQRDNTNKCKHYDKSCYKLYFECCGIYDPCIQCHLLRKNCSQDKIKITKITCEKCETEQEPSQTCINCSNSFSKNYCGKCFIWSRSEITHCDECGCCKIGNKEDILHCDKCNVCVNTKDKLTHICINHKELICGVCSESTYNCCEEIVYLGCNHNIHSNCLNKMKTNNLYKCPYCKKSMYCMQDKWNTIKINIQHTPLPNDFIRQRKVDIFCNDCRNNSTTNFHYYGLECKLCGSFNTQI